MKLTTVKPIRATFLTLFCSCFAQLNSDNMFVYAQYTSPPDCGASCYSERARQRNMDWIKGSTEYSRMVNDNSQDMSPIITLVILGGVGLGVFYWFFKSSGDKSD